MLAWRSMINRTVYSLLEETAAAQGAAAALHHAGRHGAAPAAAAAGLRAAQPGRGANAPRKSTASASASGTFINAFQTREEYPGEARRPLRVHDETNSF